MNSDLKERLAEAFDPGPIDLASSEQQVRARGHRQIVRGRVAVVATAGVLLVIGVSLTVALTHSSSHGTVRATATTAVAASPTSDVGPVASISVPSGTCTTKDIPEGVALDTPGEPQLCVGFRNNVAEREVSVAVSGELIVGQGLNDCTVKGSDFSSGFSPGGTTADGMPRPAVGFGNVYEATKTVIVTANAGTRFAGETFEIPGLDGVNWYAIVAPHGTDATTPPQELDARGNLVIPPTARPSCTPDPPATARSSGSVTSASQGLTRGPVPESANLPDGEIDLSQVPDFVSTLDRHGAVVGYIKKGDLFPTSTSGGAQPAGNGVPPSPEAMAAQNTLLIKTVYAENLVTVVGHMYPGLGFVPLGTDPGSVPEQPVVTAMGG